MAGINEINQPNQIDQTNQTNRLRPHPLRLTFHLSRPLKGGVLSRGERGILRRHL